ncbi:MAG: gfo/Idh/MocA family oxidoreductase, partial [Bacteroidetes bacterium]
MNNKNGQNRRTFLRNTVSATAGMLAAPTVLSAGVIPGKGRILPSDKINMGFIGVGGMGTGHVRSFIEHGDVHVAAICDVNRQQADEAERIVNQHYGDHACASYNDFRELLSRSDIDAIVLATPDHWHALIGIEAARQGKHMYYEKPLSLFFREGLEMRKAINRYGVVFQLGTQQRSDERFRFACELARNGKLGNMERIIISSASYSQVPIQPVDQVPGYLDYDLWLGPAPEVPYTPLRVTRNFTLIYDYSVGCISGAWGIHHVDIAQWALDADLTGPVEVEGRGQVSEDGLYDTIQTWEAIHTYASGVKVVHTDHVSLRQRDRRFDIPNSMGMMFEGSDGWVYVARGYIDAKPRSLLQTVIGPDEIQLPRSNDHRRNFLDAVRTGSPVMCPIETAVRSDAVCHQADIA